jgi:hypothetical protein
VQASELIPRTATDRFGHDPAVLPHVYSHFVEAQHRNANTVEATLGTTRSAARLKNRGTAVQLGGDDASADRRPNGATVCESAIQIH